MARAGMMSVTRRVAVEFVGTAALVSVVVGSGIMGERLADGNEAFALLANSLATGAGLLALILACGPASAAHFNPVVSTVMWLRGALAKELVVPYVVAQFAGAFLGVVLAHAMFELPLVELSTRARSGGGQVLAEAVATFGLLMVILLMARRKDAFGGFAVAAYITSAYWFTASTSFANPAVTLARCCTPTFAGIAPGDVPFFIAGQVTGAAAAALLARWLLSEDDPPDEAES